MLIISPNSKMSANLRFLIIALAATLLFVTCLVINDHPSSEISDSDSDSDLDSDSGPHHKKKETSASATATATKYKTIRQDEVEIFYLEGMVRRAEKGSVEMEDAKRELDDVISHRKHVDQSVTAIVRVIVDGQSSDANATTFSQVLKARPKAYTWDWKCFKAMIANYQAQCGTLRIYGMKYNQLFANLCHFGISPKQLSVAARQICLPHMVKPLWMAEDKFGFHENPFV